MFRTLLTFIFTISFIFPAAAQKKSLTVLGLESDPGLEKIAKKVTGILNGFAKNESKVTAQTPRELEEMKLLHCEEEKDQKCLEKIRKELKTQIIVTGKVSKQKTKAKITLFFFADGTMKYFNTIISPKASDSKFSDEIKKMWQGYFAGNPAKVKIMSPEGGVSIYINGQLVFQTMPGENLIPQLTPGTHEIKAVSKSGKTWIQKITAKPGQEISLQVKFSGKTDKVTPPVKVDKKPDDKKPDAVKITDSKPPVKEEPAKPGKKSNYWRWAFWGTAGTAVVLLAAGTYTGMQVLKYEDDKNAELEKNPSLYAGQSDVCKNPTPEMKDICDSGKNMATTTNILFGAGIAIGVISTYFLYKGYLSTSSSAEGTVQDNPGNSGNVTVFPWVSPGAGGISIGTRF